MISNIPNSAAPILANRYQLLQTLGSGGMAVVYRAKDLTLERMVAVKILRQDFSKDESFRKRFHQEAKAAGNLSHPNIVTVHDFGLDGDRLFIIMEYVPGTNLKAIVKERNYLPLNEAIDLIIQASAGIGYAHRAGLVHCDVKPHNMLVTPDGRLKVTDFGIARALSSINPEERSAVVWGSPQYLSPEQASGEPPSPASDVYSLGVVLYEMVTGKLPFYSNDPNELTRLHKEATPLPPRKLNPNIPVQYEQIILKVLAKEPSWRYRTADQFGRVLQNIKEQPILQQSSVNLEYTSNPIVDSIPATFEPRFSSNSKPAQSNTDYGTIALALLTFILAGGLIPFWLYVWFSLNSNR
jgi:serine/threonine-protein kinase